MWKSLEADLLESADTVCGWTKGPPKHRVTWWWNDAIAAAVKEKRAAWKCWKNGGSKSEYLRAKKAAKRAVYDARRVAEPVRFGEVLRREDNRAEVFKIAKHMCAANRDVIGENCVKNKKGT